MEIVYVILALVVGLGLGILITATMIRKSIEKKSQTLIEEANAEAEVI